VIIFNNTELKRSIAEDLITTYLIRSNLKENIVSINGTHYELLCIEVSKSAAPCSIYKAVRDY